MEFINAQKRTNASVDNKKTFTFPKAAFLNMIAEKAEGFTSP